jgi:hypothetical protein
MKYPIFCLLVVAGFATLEWRGANLLPGAHHVVVPTSVRSSPGGYRSFHFWHLGYSGGK